MCWQEYLLLFSNPPVYHVSISSSNIMLDENFTAKVEFHSLFMLAFGLYKSYLKYWHLKKLNTTINCITIEIIIIHSLLQLSDVGLLSTVGTYVKMPHSSCSEGDLLLLSLQMFAMTCFPLQCNLYS